MKSGASLTNNDVARYNSLHGEQQMIKETEKKTARDVQGLEGKKEL